MITLLHICEIDICELAQAIVKKKRRELSPLNYLNNVTVLSIADRSQSRAMIFTEKQRSRHTKKLKMPLFSMPEKMSMPTFHFSFIVNSNLVKSLGFSNK